jgi:hypothetical protein
MKVYGKTTWMIPDTYLQKKENSRSSDPADRSHEAICVLNTSDNDAHIALTLFFEDREPNTAFTSFCGARRTHHIRLDKIRDKDGNGIPEGVPYAILLQSTAPVVVQYSRLDTSAAEMALMTTIAYAVEE